MITFKFNEYELIAMTKFKDSEEINKIIIEMAKSNNWVSRNDLKAQTGKGIQTIKNYLQKYISGLIDTKDFTEKVARNKGEGKTIIEKYKLKSSLDDLLAIFNFIENKNDLKQLMQTDYYRSFIPEIGKKAKEDFRFTDSDYQIFEIPMLKEFYYMGIKYSPSFAYILLKTKSDISEFFEKVSAFPPSMIIYYILYGVLFYDAIEGIIDEEDFSKFQILGQSVDIPSLLLQKVIPD